MNYSDALNLAINLQNLDIDLEELPLNIHLKNTGNVLVLCFIEMEKDDYLVVVETNSLGGEELRIVPKDNIEYISIFYEFSILDGTDYDKMIL